MTALALRRLPVQARACLFAIALGLAGAFGLSGAAQASDLPGRVGRIADTDGAVWMRDRDDHEWMSAQRNRPLTAGDRLATDDGARAELHVGSSTLRVGPGSEIEMATLDDERVEVAVLRGSVALRLRSDNVANEYAVLTDEGRFQPLHAGHYRIDRGRDSSFADVWQGALRFESQDSALEVGAGRRAEFWQERDGRTHYTWTEPDRDAFASWAIGRDLDDTRRYASSTRYVPPEMTGAWELERYGRWDRHPEYGGIWYPQGVAADWAPYRDGRWAWVSPWGWTWVDDAPWGFAPFHYGRWVSAYGRWGWVPGSYSVRPAYAPALVAWLGSGNVSVGISIGGPTVGWVPLAPFEVYRPYYAYTPRYWQRINPGRRYEPRPVRTGPIMYTNQGVPGGVTVVPSTVLRERQPVAQARLQSRTLDPRALRQIDAPPAAPRLAAEPGGARPQPRGLPSGLGRSLPASVERMPSRRNAAPQAAAPRQANEVRDLRDLPRIGTPPGREAADARERAPANAREGALPQERGRALPGERERALPSERERALPNERERALPSRDRVLPAERVQPDERDRVPATRRIDAPGREHPNDRADDAPRRNVPRPMSEAGPGRAPAVIAAPPQVQPPQRAQVPMAAPAQPAEPRVAPAVPAGRAQPEAREPRREPPGQARRDDAPGGGRQAGNPRQAER